MYRHIFPFCLSLLAFSCSAPKHQHQALLRPSEKEVQLQQANQNYSDASIIGKGAFLIPASEDAPSGFFDSVKSIEGFEVDESTGILRMAQAILFDFDSYRVKEDAIRPLSELLSAFQKQEGGRLLITGYTDNIGDPSYNKQLSLKRAEAVKSILLELGLSEDKAIATGEGASSPIESNKSASGRAKNRRVEFKLISE